MSGPGQLEPRPQRLRRLPALRCALAEVRLSPADFIYPLFVTTARQPKPVASMPGISQLPVTQAVRTIRRLSKLGLGQFILFGVTPAPRKDDAGSFASDPDCPVNQTLAAVRAAGLSGPGGSVVMYADLCLCEYTRHGHCGLLHDSARTHQPPTVHIDLSATLERYRAIALAQAQAGADFVAPSGMMDGQVGAIRQALDANHHGDVGILAYSVKYASSLYGPFREAGEGGMKFGDRRSYQMDYRQGRTWRTELLADIAQGADMVMVKPAATYLDILRQVRDACDLPLAGYHVSGEFAMLHAAARQGWLDLRSATLETTTAIKRAGADLIVTYFAPQLVEWLA